MSKKSDEWKNMIFMICEEIQMDEKSQLFFVVWWNFETCMMKTNYEFEILISTFYKLWLRINFKFCRNLNQTLKSNDVAEIFNLQCAINLIWQTNYSHDTKMKIYIFVFWWQIVLILKLGQVFWWSRIFNFENLDDWNEFMKFWNISKIERTRTHLCFLCTRVRHLQNSITINFKSVTHISTFCTNCQQS